MEFKSLRNIESSFRQIRLFGIVFLSLCAVVTVWSVWNSYRFADGKSSVSCPLKPSDSAPLKHSTMPP